MTESPTAVTCPALKPGPGGRVVEVVVVGAVFGVVATELVVESWVGAPRWCAGEDFAEVSRTRNAPTAAATATRATAAAMILPDGRPLRELTCCAMDHSFAAHLGEDSSDPVQWG